MLDINPFPGNAALRLLRKLYRAWRPVPFAPDRLMPAAATGNVSPSLVKTHAQPSAKSPPAWIVALFEGMDAFDMIEIYIHGSLADQTQTAFSDVDDMIIIDREKLRAISDARKLEHWLNRVDRRFCRVDPLQHHGHWIVYLDELKAYDASRMPLTVLNGALVVKGRSHIAATINTEQSIAGTARNVQSALGVVNHLYKRYSENDINSYQMKQLVGSLLLMPAYLFQLQGTEIDKKGAIENAGAIFGPVAVQAVRCAESIRSQWQIALKRPGVTLFSCLGRIIRNPHLYRVFASKCAPKFPKTRFPCLDTDMANAFLSETANKIKCVNNR